MAKPSLAWRLKRPAKLLLIAAAIPIVIGIGWRLFEGGKARVDVASALFICGGVIIAGRRCDRWRRARPADERLCRARVPRTTCPSGKC